MGFFDLFKKKKNPVPKELQGFLGDVYKKAFPGGEAEIEKLVQRIMSLTDNRIPEENVHRAVRKAGTLLVIAQDKTEQRVVSSIRMTNPSINESDAKIIYNVLLENMSERMYGSSEFASVFSHALGNVEENPIHDSFGPLGSNTNPIPVCGIPASYDFVSRLELENGTPVNIKRFGSGNVDVCSETVDFYYAYDNAGNEVGKFVICPYCPETSKYPPEGFRFKK